MILRNLAAEERKPASGNRTLRDATQGWVAERKVDKDLKRTTLAGYELMFERLYRDLGADTLLTEFEDGRLRPYFQDFKSYRVVNARTAENARAEGKTVQQGQSSDGQPAQLAASRSRSLLSKRPCNSPTSYMAPGRTCAEIYRFLPLDAPRTKTVTSAEAHALKEQGWDVHGVDPVSRTVAGFSG